MPAARDRAKRPIVPPPPACTYSPPERPELRCGRRHWDGEGNHLDPDQQAWFGRDGDGRLLVFEAGLELAGQP